MANILEVKDLCKTYVIDKRQNNVLRNVNFEVEEGDMVAIMGPSGSGKSTLLYSVSGMDVPTSGTVCFAGRDIAKLSQTELAKVRLDEMGFIFQQMYMMKNLTILDNILLPAMESKKDERPRAEKVASCCKRVLYILDGTIKGEYKAPEDENLSEADRERRLQSWLLDLGW